MFWGMWYKIGTSTVQLPSALALFIWISSIDFSVLISLKSSNFTIPVPLPHH